MAKCNISGDNYFMFFDNSGFFHQNVLPSSVERSLKVFLTLMLGNIENKTKQLAA